MNPRSLKRQRLDYGRMSVVSVAPATVGNASSITKSKKSYKRGSYSKSNKLANFIKAVVRSSAEHKEVLTSVGVTYNGTQSNVVVLNPVAEGSDYNQRVGREITHSYLEVNLGIFCLPPTGGNNALGDFGFWAIVLDRQPTGSLPAFNVIFDDSLGIGQGSDFRITTTNQDRFKIISRNEWSIGSNGQFNGPNPSSGMSGASPYHVKEFIDLSKLGGRDQTVNYNGTAGGIATIDSGAIYFVSAATLSSANATAQLIGQAKYRYTDV